MKNKKLIISALILTALVTLCACAGKTNPYDAEEKKTFEINGVTVTVPESMNADALSDENTLYIEMPDAQLAMVAINVGSSGFMNEYRDSLQNGGYENLSVGEVSEETVGGKKVSVFTYTYTIDNITLKNDCVFYEKKDNVILLNGITLPAYNEDVSDLVEYLLKNLD